MSTRVAARCARLSAESLRFCRCCFVLTTRSRIARIIDSIKLRCLSYAPFALSGLRLRPSAIDDRASRAAEACDVTSAQNLSSKKISTSQSRHTTKLRTIEMSSATVVICAVLTALAFISGEYGSEYKQKQLVFESST